jgi:DNA-binding transcriptional LysR family regulator
MKFRHLEHFVAAAEELNFTHAADRLHVLNPRSENKFMI